MLRQLYKEINILYILCIYCLIIYLINKTERIRLHDLSYIALCFMIYISAHNQEILRFSQNPTSFKIELAGSETYQNVANY